jgi:hypothetical protein
MVERYSGRWLEGTDEVANHPSLRVRTAVACLQDQKKVPRDKEKVIEDMAERRAKDGTGTIEAKFRKYEDELVFKKERGWSQADAEAHLCLTGVVGASLAKAMEQRSSRYAASTYALYMSLQRGALIDEKLRCADAGSASGLLALEGGSCALRSQLYHE